MDSGDAVQLTVLAVLLLLSAFFSSAETAVTTVSKIRIKSLADEGNRRACTLIKIMEKPEKMISTILVGDTPGECVRGLPGSLYGSEAF